jgi:hypothetical protein
MGPPLTESPGWCQVVERNDMRRSPSGASTAACLANHDGRAGARTDGGNRCVGIGCRHDISMGCDALQGAPGEDCRQVADLGSTNDIHKAMTSRVTASLIRGSGLRRQVTTATPFAPEELAIRRAIGSRQLTTGRRPASSRGTPNRRDTRRVAYGIAWALDALMRLHFLIHNRMPVASGVDVQQLRLWF